MLKLKGKNPVANRKLKKILEPVEVKADNMFLETSTITKNLTVSELLEVLEDGYLVYWDLVRDKQGNITAVKPYPRHIFYANLMKMREKESDDIMYDFKSRL